MSDDTSVIPDAWMHVYGQFCWHGEVRIVGTVGGLEALRDAVTMAIENGKGETEVTASDGEGYGVIVNRASTVAQLGSPEYLVEIEHQIANNEFRRQRKIERSLVRKDRGPFDP